MAETKGAFPIAGVLGIIFVTLKLAEVGAVASWPWLWVLSPFWIPATVVLAVLAIGLILLGLGAAGDAAIRAYDRRKEAKANVPAPSAKK